MFGFSVCVCVYAIRFPDVANTLVNYAERHTHKHIQSNKQTAKKKLSFTANKLHTKLSYGIFFSTLFKQNKFITKLTERNVCRVPVSHAKLEKLPKARSFASWDVKSWEKNVALLETDRKFGSLPRSRIRQVHVIRSVFFFSSCSSLYLMVCRKKRHTQQPYIFIYAFLNGHKTASAGKNHKKFISYNGNIFSRKIKTMPE
jgi:hypothetical protein